MSDTNDGNETTESQLSADFGQLASLWMMMIASASFLPFSILTHVQDTIEDETSRESRPRTKRIAKSGNAD
jgi:hypothetical protein